MRRGALPLFALALSSCGGDALTDPGSRDREGGITTVRVSAEGDRGTRTAPLPYSDDGVAFTARVEVFDAQGNPVTNFNGYMALSATPGALTVDAAEGVVADAEPRHPDCPPDPA